MPDIVPEAIESLSLRTDKGRSVFGLSRERPVLLIFLRHFGCPFCREALSDLSKDYERIRENGVDVVLVHMYPEHIADRMMEVYELSGLPHISDPAQEAYRAFGLERASLNQLNCIRMWVRGIAASFLSGHFLGNGKGDFKQLPGLFLIRNGRVVKQFHHELPCDRPDYLEFVGEAVNGDS